MEIENFTRCRTEPCRVVKRNNAILKHIVKSDCRKSYTDEQFKELQLQSKARHHSLKRIQSKKQYDPVKRAQRHKECYDPAKYKELNNPFLRNQRYKKEKIQIEKRCKEDSLKEQVEIQSKWNKNYEFKARSTNKSLRQSALNISQCPMNHLCIDSKCIEVRLNHLCENSKCTELRRNSVSVEKKVQN